MSVEANEQAEIDARAVIERILAEPEFVAATRRVEKDYLAEFMAAETDEARRQIWAKVRALQDLLTELGGTVQRGKIAEKTREKREAASARSRGANSRN